MIKVDEADGLTSSLMAQFGPDVACDVIGEFRVGWEVQKTLAAINQRKIAESVKHGCHTLEGLGQRTHSVDLRAYLYWHSRTNGQCWKDPQFWQEYGRDNPETRVGYVPRKLAITKPEFRAAAPRRPEPRIQLTGLDAFAA